VRPHFFTGENQMNGPPGRCSAGLHQHIDSCNMTMFQTEALTRLCNPRQILSPDDDIDVSRQASRVGLSILYIQIDSQSANYAILDSGRCENLLD
jgi:hypothetical protein